MRVRRVVLWIAGGLALVVSGLILSALVFWMSADTSTVGKLGFRNELEIPPLAEPRMDARGRKVFDLRLQTGTSELLPGRKTETWGVNGAYLGPTIRASRGDRVVLKVRNGLPETTTLHWHGMRLPARADGNPHQPIEPGATWSPSWTIDQPASTLWYHPHQMGRTAEHVYRGVAGLFLIDDAEAVASYLPHDYGIDDIPLIVQDKQFDGDGSLNTSAGLISPTGVLGDEILVNGTHDPHVAIARDRVRFRLLNASNARVYNIGFEDDRPFELVGSDGGLLAAPARTTRVQLSPGERAEIVARFGPRERVVLRSFEPELGASFWEERFSGGDDSFDLIQVRAGADLRRSSPVPERLAVHDLPSENDAVASRVFELSGQGSVNGKSMDMGRIDEVVTAGSTELWEVHNSSGTPHSFHVHGIQFAITEYAGSPPPPALGGWKDTVYVPPGERVRFVASFPDYPDPETPYMFHCHVLQHEDRGMMGQFVVVEPGEDESPEADHNHGEP